MTAPCLCRRGLVRLRKRDLVHPLVSTPITGRVIGVPCNMDWEPVKSESLGDPILSCWDWWWEWQMSPLRWGKNKLELQELCIGDGHKWVSSTVWLWNMLRSSDNQEGAQSRTAAPLHWEEPLKVVRVSEHTGEITFLVWPGNASATSQRSWWKWPGFGLPYWNCYPCDPDQIKWKKERKIHLLNFYS